LATYKASDIKVLDEITHVRTNPGMYIGETSNPSHLIEEALDNALDECLPGHASIVAVTVDTKKFIYSVIDDGRGIPISNDVPITISTKLFSGAKFKGSKTAYSICSGKHGVGLITVNALSTEYDVEIYRQGEHATFSFRNQKLKNTLREPHTDKCPFSTKISFRPDKEIFETLLADIDQVRKRLYVASVELPKCTFVLKVDKKKEIIKTTLNKFFKSHCISDSDSEISKSVDVSVNAKPEEMKIRFCYSLTGPIMPRIVSSVNLLPVEGGGTHVNIFTDVIKTYMLAKAKRAGIKILPQDCLCGLRAYINASLLTPEFGGQTKDKLINRKTDLSKLEAGLTKQVSDYFNKHTEELEVLLNHFDLYRKKINSKRIKTNDNSKRSATKFTKLRECQSSEGSLFIVEGDSAAGGLILCRDPKKHAIFPLRGKIPSVATAKEITKNKEIGELIQSLGTGIEPNFDIDKLKYKEIVCAADADADGGHIACLLIIALSVLVPDVVKNGHLFLAHTPLYAINEGKTFIPIWDQKELDKARKKKRKILRVKGLGELNPWQLKVSMIDEETRRWQQIEYSDDIDKIMKLFVDVDSKRKLLGEDDGK